MKKSVVFSIIFLLWMVVASYAYLCFVKNHCSKEQKEQTVTENSSESVSYSVSVDTMSSSSDTNSNAAVDEQEFMPLRDRLQGSAILFDFGEATTNIDKNLQQDMRSLASYCQEYPDISITIIGYADNIGTQEANYKISKQRAEFVKGIMVNNGVPEDHITVVAKGSAEPVASNETESGRALNRRVKIIIKK